MDTIPDPRYVTLDANGDGSIEFRGKRPNMLMQVTKVTVETAATGSGTVTIYYRGQLMSSKAVALMMSAVGLLNVAAGDSVEVRVTGGVQAAEVKITAHYAEVKPADAAPESGMAFTEAVGFSLPVDNPVLLASTDQQLGNPFEWETGPLDVRAYNSYHLSLDVAEGTWLANDMAVVEVKFFDEFPVDITVPAVFAETFYVYRNTFLDFPTSIADAIHGGWMTIVVYDWSGGPRSTTLIARLYGSYRSVPSLWIRPHPGNGNFEGANVLYDKEIPFLAAGATDLDNAKFAVGRARVRLETTAGNATMSIQYGSLISTLRDSLTVVGAGLQEKEIILPVRQARVIITNGPTAVNTVRAQIIQERFPQ